MTGRLVEYGVYVLTAAAMLLAVTSAPMRLHGSRQSALAYNSFSSNFAVLRGWQGGSFKLSVGSSFRAAPFLPADFKDELDADIEDELTEASPTDSVFFETAFAPSPKRHTNPISFFVALAARPLRC